MRWTTRRAGTWAAGTALAVGASLVMAVPPAVAATDTQILLLGFNDYHGRLESPGKVDGKAAGGAAQLAGALTKLQSEFAAANPTGGSVVVSAGDNIGASPFISAVQKDEPTLAALNAMNVAVSAVGNHEFDRGFADLTDRVTKSAAFPYLGANVYKDGKPALQEYAVKTIAGVRMGFIGAVTKQTASLVSPGGIQGVDFRDPVVETNRVAAQLTDGNDANGEADVLVLLVHEGADTETCANIPTDPALGPIVNGVSNKVNAIVTGHTHQKYACAFPVTGLGYDRPVVQALSYGGALDKITFSYDSAAKKVTAAKAEVLDVVGFPEDPAVAKIVADAKAASAEVGKVQVGTITADIRRAYATPAAGGTPTEDRGKESSLSNLIATAQLSATEPARLGGAQIAFMNPGGVRADLTYDAKTDVPGDAAGVVTYAEANTTQPFANGVITMTLTGAQIKAVLEEQWQPAGSSRPYLQLGLSKGFRYVYDASRPQGQRILANRITLDGKVLSPTADYRVTVNSFLSTGGDNFTTFTKGTKRQDNGFNDLNVLVDYLTANAPVSPPPANRAVSVADSPIDGTSVIVTSPAATAVTSAGAPVTIRGMVAGTALTFPNVRAFLVRDGRATAVTDVAADGSFTMANVRMLSGSYAVRLNSASTVVGWSQTLGLTVKPFGIVDEEVGAGQLDLTIATGNFSSGTRVLLTRDGIGIAAFRVATTGGPIMAMTPNNGGALQVVVDTPAGRIYGDSIKG